MVLWYSLRRDKLECRSTNGGQDSMTKPTRRQSKILDECLGYIWAEQSTVEECLRLFPNDAERLAPVLTLAAEARDYLAPKKPKPSFVADSRRRILLDVSHRLYKATLPRPQTKPAWRWKPAQVFISLMLAIGILAISTGVVQAAYGALPGDALYGMKRGLEGARLAFTWSDEGDIRLLAQFTDTRLAELEALLAWDRYEDLEDALEGYEEALSALMALVADSDSDLDPELMEYVLVRLVHHQDVLARVRERVSVVAMVGIDHAIEHLSLCLAAFGYELPVVMNDLDPIDYPFLADDPGEDASDANCPFEHGDDDDDDDDQGDDQGGDDDDDDDDQGGGQGGDDDDDDDDQGGGQGGDDDDDDDDQGGDD